MVTVKNIIRATYTVCKYPSGFRTDRIMSHSLPTVFLATASSLALAFTFCTSQSEKYLPLRDSMPSCTAQCRVVWAPASTSLKNKAAMGFHQPPEHFIHITVEIRVYNTCLKQIYGWLAIAESVPTYETQTPV